MRVDKKAKLIKKLDSKHCLVEFANGYQKTFLYSNYIKGEIKNPTEPSVFEKGYLGEGKYKVSENKKITLAYSTWHSMIRRCYSEYFHFREKTYCECTVCEEWLNFQKFAEWFDKNYPKTGIKYELDKDLLYKNNKIYSPKTCCFLPKELNALLTKRQNCRGKCCIGVTKTKHGFIARVNDKNKRLQGKYRKTEREAFNDYKYIKENLIKEKAEKYKDYITKKAYTSLLKYRVEYTD